MSKLFIVPTPIGNLSDITFRAVETLKSADIILCEDTRTTKKLLSHYGILDKKCLAYHIFNEHQQLDNYISLVLQHETVALVSDAGTPGISDPGFLLIREALNRDIDVECLPGPTAFVPALIQSGLPCSSFRFIGFLPHKKGKETLLRQIAASDETVICYESPHRLLKTLSQMAEIFDENKPLSVSKELSKIHSFTFRGTAKEACNFFQDKAIKGEFVIVIGK